MKVRTYITKGSSVENALKDMIRQCNKDLQDQKGRISDMHAEIKTSSFGIHITLALLIDEHNEMKKSIVGVNVRGSSHSDALLKAEIEINKIISEKGYDGRVIVKEISPPFPMNIRKYVTIIAGVNEIK